MATLRSNTLVKIIIPVVALGAVAIWHVKDMNHRWR